MLVSDKAALKMRILYSAPASIVDFQHLRVYRSRSSALAFNRRLVCSVTVSARTRHKTPARVAWRGASWCAPRLRTHWRVRVLALRSRHTLPQRGLRHANVRTVPAKKIPARGRDLFFLHGQ